MKLSLTALLKTVVFASESFLTFWHHTNAGKKTGSVPAYRESIKKKVIHCSINLVFFRQPKPEGGNWSKWEAVDYDRIWWILLPAARYVEAKN